jgi:membrane peptidoglycan carboxypeptidase
MFGPRSNLYFDNYAVAAKTGTTNDFKDGWTIGYTPKTVVGVWVGNNNNSPMTKLGEMMAGPAYHQIMQYCLYLYPPDKEFAKP